MGWTDEQKRVISERNCNILVSAAAGSGKTATMLERVFNRVCKDTPGHDIDEFLMVTFTKAAAAQMKDKLMVKFEDALADNPFDEHIARQLVLLQKADIATIDSFCLKVVKENFSLLDIDADFCVGEPGMLRLLKSDVMDDLFKAKRNMSDRDFLQVQDMFGKESDDGCLKDVISNIFYVAESFPEPALWYEKARDNFVFETEEELFRLPWFENYIKKIKKKLKDACDMAKRALLICESCDGHDKNEKIARDETETVISILSCDRLEDMIKIYRSMTFARISKPKENIEEYEIFKKLRDGYKQIIRDAFGVFTKTENEIFMETKTIGECLIPLINLVEEFSNLYLDIKLEKKVLDFSDVEHLAYKLLCAGHDENGRVIPTELGREISKRYVEIYIDEYQDSNYLQEDILCACSRMSEGENNMFMVGDVKQSIYRFRMARPDLFMDKLKRYKENGDNVRIDLKNNFRSRKEVLLPVNYFFYQLMGGDFGGIEYDREAALVPSLQFPEEPADTTYESSKNTEILFVDNDLENADRFEIEAELIAGRIREIVDEEKGLLVYDDDLKVYRKARYRDIVILTRNISGTGDVLYRYLNDRGIPVYLEDPSGFFNAVEIKTIMSYLSVIDNSRQDIDMYAVLRSPIGRLDESDITDVVNYSCEREDKKLCLYEKCELYMLDHEDDIAARLRTFSEDLEMFKADKVRLSISELIWKVLEHTKYYAYASAMPYGDRRKANIDMLLEKADAYEDGFYKGLFNFIRYIEKLKVNEVDFGEAATLGEDEDVVRIISMHKSKGLEFPVVFISGLHKQYNESDSKDRVLILSDYGITTDYINREKRYRMKSVMKEIFRNIAVEESRSEELRVLYVAMTRAKEKLIITGCDKEIAKTREKLAEGLSSDVFSVPYSLKSMINTFMKHILLGMVRFDALCDKLEVKDYIAYKEIQASTLYLDVVNNIAGREIDIKDFVDKAKDFNDDIFLSYRENFDYRYEYEIFTKLNAKMSISDIKKMKAYDGEGYDVSTEFASALDNEPKSESVKQDERLTGAVRGTLVHRFMELIDFEALPEGAVDNALVESLKQKLSGEGKFEDWELKAINPYKISEMLNSSLGVRMIRAAKKGKLYREQQFSAGVDASSIYGDKLFGKSSPEDIVIVQGIIDAFFFEDDKIVLMDYKTDYAQREVLLGRYRAQLDEYAVILARITGYQVKEKIMYSFYLGKEIEVVDDFDA